MSNGLKVLIICAAALFACLILASALNSSKYYIKETNEGVEVWKGNFSPRGQKMVVSLKNIEAPEDINGTVSKQKAYALPFSYFMTKAEKLSEKEGIPNFEAIRKELKKAQKYAVTRSQIDRVNNRLNHIDYTFMLYKADMAADRATADGYKKALKYLKQAKEFAANPFQVKCVEDRIQEIKSARSNSKGPDAAQKSDTDKTKGPAKQQDIDAPNPQQLMNENKAADKPAKEHIM